MSDGVLLTGATGFVGMEVLARYLERTDRRVYALVRGANERDVTARVEHTLRSCSAPIILTRGASWPCVATSHVPASALVGGAISLPSG